MKKIDVYTKSNCSFCVALKQWLTIREFEFEEHSLNDVDARNSFKEQYPGLTQVPQVFVMTDDGNYVNIGGYSEVIRHPVFNKQ